MKNRPSVIAYTDGLPVAELDAFARRLEALDYDSLWVTEFTGRDPYTTAAHVLARTERIRVATGIANVYSHDAIVAAQNRHTLAELSGGRFVLGLGVSPSADGRDARLEWVPPVRKMRAYLDAMDATRVDSPPPCGAGAHLARRQRSEAPRTRGPTPRRGEHVPAPSVAHEAGPGVDRAGQAAERGPAVASARDPDRARKISRRALSIYMPLPAYQKEWRKAGFDESDWAGGGSDR